MKTVTCLKCGWVHFEVPRMHAEQEVIRFNEFYDTLPTKEQEDFYGSKKASIHLYDSCQLCNGSYKNFRDYKEDDCPDGVTMSPIIDRYE